MLEQKNKKERQRELEQKQNRDAKMQVSNRKERL